MKKPTAVPVLLTQAAINFRVKSKVFRLKRQDKDKNQSDWFTAERIQTAILLLELYSCFGNATETRKVSRNV